MKLGLLLSGNLGFEILQKIVITNEISFVMTDNKSNDILTFCEKEKIPCFKGNPRNGNSSRFLNSVKCDYIFSINYLFLIDKEIINHPKYKAINIHGSLLPKYRGRTPHVWAIINNEKKTGITAHYIDENCDTGDIISQIEIQINDETTGADVLENFKVLYWKIIEDILICIKNNSLKSFKQDNSKATYFGKRTPEDGHINWDWQKERIDNWVRAQSYPYPGAFSYINNEKIIIDKIRFSDDGFDFNMPNGLILSIEPIKVKTSNGVVILDSIRNYNSSMNKNEILK